MKNAIENLLVQPGKSFESTNPLMPHIYCADPTAVEYRGRLYVYGTHDHEQYLHDPTGRNTYERIQSLVIFSTDDMVNWTYHGVINVKEIAPWVIAAWAPSVVSRIENDGNTHFYLYFSNSGWGTGVLTATSPTGPWQDPLKRSLIDGNTAGLGNGCTPFDPGAVIDDDGVGWLTFGASFGNYESPEEQYLPGGARIVKLGADMISLAGDIMPLPAPYQFEANELNYINGTYVYTYNTSWKKRGLWEIENTGPPPVCCMSYMTTKTPLDPDSWAYRGHYFNNPGDNGLDHCNNHTHLHKYKDHYYLFYHTLELQQKNGVDGGFRSLSAIGIEVDEETLTIKTAAPNSSGLIRTNVCDPFTVNLFAAHAVSAGIAFNPFDEGGNMYVSACEPGSWVMVKSVDFKQGVEKIKACVKGKGRLEIRAEDIHAKTLGSVAFSNPDWDDVQVSLSVSGVCDIFFVFDGDDGNDGNTLNAYSWCVVMDL